MRTDIMETYKKSGPVDVGREVREVSPKSFIRKLLLFRKVIKLCRNSECRNLFIEIHRKLLDWPEEDLITYLNNNPKLQSLFINE